MSEKKIILEDIAPIDLYGVNDSKLELIKKRFPKLKIVARGEVIKASGDDEEINQLEMVLNILTAYFNRYGNLTENAIEQILGGNSNRTVSSETSNAEDVLVFGNSGLIIKARTVNQRRIVESIGKNDMVFAIGPAGTGKTYTAVALAVRALKNREVKKLFLPVRQWKQAKILVFYPVI